MNEMKALMAVYQLTAHLPLLPDILGKLRQALVYVIVHKCECFGAQNYMNQMKTVSTNDVYTEARLNSINWCISCRHSVLYTGVSAHFYTRLFIHNDGEWKATMDRCVCKYLPAGVLDDSSHEKNKKPSYCLYCRLRRRQKGHLVFTYQFGQ